MQKFQISGVKFVLQFGSQKLLCNIGVLQKYKQNKNNNNN